MNSVIQAWIQAQVKTHLILGYRACWRWFPRNSTGWIVTKDVRRFWLSRWRSCSQLLRHISLKKGPQIRVRPTIVCGRKETKRKSLDMTNLAAKCRHDSPLLFPSVLLLLSTFFLLYLQTLLLSTFSLSLLFSRANLSRSLHASISYSFPVWYGCPRTPEVYIAYNVLWYTKPLCSQTLTLAAILSALKF